MSVKVVGKMRCAPDLQAVEWSISTGEFAKNVGERK